MHIITRFDKGGSAENTFLTLAGLDPARYDLLLVTGENGRRELNDREGAAIAANLAALRGRGIRVIALPSLHRNPNPLADLAAFFALFRLIGQEQPRIVHTHTSKAGILGRWAARLRRVPIVVHTPHGHVFWGYFGPGKTRLFIALERWTARITTALVMLTERERADHLRFRIAPEGKFTVIHSGVALERFRPDPARAAETRAGLGIPPETLLLATAGRLTPVKGQETLIRAVAELSQRGEKLSLLLLGEGELRRDLEALATGLGIAATVRFLGWQPDVAPFLDACDLFCLPSLNEGMGKVLVEAMALGKPLVASDVAGIPDLVRPGENGLLVPPGNVPAWAGAIAGLLADPPERRRLGEGGRRLATRYGSGEMVRAIGGLYEKLLEGYPPPGDPGKLR